MRGDANKIALRAVQNILDAAKPLDLEVAGKAVTCSVSRVAAEAWPTGGIQGLDRPDDGKWPAAVDVTCRWEGGGCVLRIQCDYVKGDGRYRHLVGVRVTTRPKVRTVIWTTVPNKIADAEDGARAKLPVVVFTFQ